MLGLPQPSALDGDAHKASQGRWGSSPSPPATLPSVPVPLGGQTEPSDPRGSSGQQLPTPAGTTAPEELSCGARTPLKRQED